MFTRGDDSMIPIPNRLIFTAALAASFAAPAQALTLFSIDSFSPSTAFVSAADVLAPGPISGPPAVVIPFGALGLVPGDDIDAMSYIFPRAFPLHFSVDPASFGLPGPAAPDVFTEAMVGQAAGDIYFGPLPGPGGNTLVVNQDLLGLVPAIPPGVPPPGPIDNLDALELTPDGFIPGPVGLFYSLTPQSPTLAMLGASPADILTTSPAGAPMVFTPAAALGLMPLDDVDALMIGPGVPAIGGIAFSLAPGSPSLGAVLTPADVLGVGIGPVPIPLIPAIGLGLAGATDDLNAIAAIPEPQTWATMLAGLGLVGWLGRRRKA